jgi:putative serine protease PepD
VKATDPASSVHGVSVEKVNPGSGAEAAGIDVGSVITKLDDHPVDNTVALVAAVRAHNPGDKVNVTFTHDGAGERTVPVTLGAA